MDYYSFGMLMPGRSYSSPSYRYGFNGKEKDDEVKGGGNNLNYGARIYDPRLGRWLSVDPLTDMMPWLAPYHYSYNNPVYYLDNDGRIAWPIAKNGNGSGWNTKAGWFGQQRKTHAHQGVDINKNTGGSTDLGAPVYSTHSGKVVQVKLYTDDNNSGGTRVTIQSPDGSFQTVYMHMETAIVKTGDEIKEGQQIGTIGGSGMGKANGHAVHLHYEIRKKGSSGAYAAINPESSRGELIDPQKWISGESTTQEQSGNQSSSDNWYDPVVDAGKSFVKWWGSWSFKSLFKKAPNYTKFIVNTQNEPLRFYSSSVGTKNDLGSIEKGKELIGTGKTANGRSEVTFGGKTGWVSTKYIKKK